MDTNDIFWKLTRGVRFGNKFRQGYKTTPDPAVQQQPKTHVQAQEFPVPNGIKKRKSSASSEGSDDDGDNAVPLSSFQHRKKAAKAGPEPAADDPKPTAEKLRKLHRLHVLGTDVPAPVTSFDDMSDRLGVQPQIVANLRAAGYFEPTPVQMQAVPVMLERREVLACAPTGSGKTAAYLVPVLQHLRQPRNAGCRALVLAPSRELARQIALEASRLAAGTGLRVRCLDRARRRPDGAARPVSAKYDLLVSTPNRLIFLLDAEPPLLSLRAVEWLVVDESDKLFEAGERGFREQLGRVYSACDSAQVRRALFSATFAHDVDQWCQLNLDNVVTVSVGQKNTASDVVEQELVFVGSEAGKLYAFRNIMQKGLATPCIIFVQTKERAKELFRELIYDGVMVDVIHADRTQLQRDNVVKAFRAGRVWVLICTELMGRGIDFKGVNLVINYDLPPSTTSYIHRIGRTGRAGRPGRAVSFFTSKDVPSMRQLAHLVKNSGCEVPDYLLQVPRKSKKDRREMAVHPIRRDTIDTTPRFDRDRMARIKALKKAADKRRAAGEDGSQRAAPAGKKKRTGKKADKPAQNKGVGKAARKKTSGREGAGKVTATANGAASAAIKATKKRVVKTKSKTKASAGTTKKKPGKTNGVS
ncbi:probable ATP-dependent RNA helicase DDX52 [Pollicipes pollicipes]|uniref:probable ATP-dependent RNA helicase DDX52 n=1 Tax=Pollicipes pollicipes TaxID=41117 RepID=UPI0018850207|nr:probable ATP-dependent RNA helicase DDX52 [Pollicipes pollicipes]XP_037076051.1 probable ATP-dependent RNA helicase DDX52 [Pollicipes pollicipes]XP_037076053.1 probable ATP-dependent RNA helicase DDX52 [Pollicipes pollicipes]